jgi:cytochrome c556
MFLGAAAVVWLISSLWHSCSSPHAKVKTSSLSVVKEIVKIENNVSSLYRLHHPFEISI